MITFTLKESQARSVAKRLMANRGGIVSDVEVIIELIKLSRDSGEPIEFQRWDPTYINGRKIFEKKVLDRETIESFLSDDYERDFRPQSSD